MEMKKAFSIFVALALVITLAACQGEKVPTQPHEPGSHGTSKPYCMTLLPELSLCVNNFLVCCQRLTQLYPKTVCGSLGKDRGL